MTRIARFSTPKDSDKPPGDDKREVAKFDMDDFDDYEEPTTAGAKVVQLAEFELYRIGLEAPMSLTVSLL